MKNWDNICTDCGDLARWRFCCSSYCDRCCNKAHHYGCSDVTIEREKLFDLLGESHAKEVISLCEVRR